MYFFSRDCFLFFLSFLVRVHEDVLDRKLGGGCIDVLGWVQKVELVGEAFEAADELLRVVVANGTYSRGYVRGVLLCHGYLRVVVLLIENKSTCSLSSCACSPGDESLCHE